MRDLTRSKTDAIRETHGPGDISSLCRACGQPLPCDALNLAEEIDLLRGFEQIQRDERGRLEQRAVRYRNVYQRTADVLFWFYMGSVGVWLISDLESEPIVRLVSNPEEWRLAGHTSLGLALVMYGVSRMTLREVPAKHTGIALLITGASILAAIVGGLLILNLD